jgi:hypothetical protein
MDAPTTEPGTLPPSFVRPARIVLYLLLLASAALSLLGLPVLEQAVHDGRSSPWVLMIPAVAFAAFVVLYAVYRFALVRAGRYHAGKAFVQVGLMALTLTLVVPGSLGRYRAATAPGAAPGAAVDLAGPLASEDGATRALAAEVVRHRGRDEALRHVPRLIELLDDPAPEVRHQAERSLAALAGEEPGGGGRAAERWRAYWQAHGGVAADR